MKTLNNRQREKLSDVKSTVRLCIANQVPAPYILHAVQTVFEGHHIADNYGGWGELADKIGTLCREDAKRDEKTA